MLVKPEGIEQNVNQTRLYTYILSNQEDIYQTGRYVFNIT